MKTLLAFDKKCQEILTGFFCGHVRRSFPGRGLSEGERLTSSSRMITLLYTRVEKEAWRAGGLQWNDACFFLVAVAVSVSVLCGCAAPMDLGPGKAPTPGAVTGVHHILLTVADLDKSVHFYRDMLGMRVEFRMAHFVMLRAGNFGVALSTRPRSFEKKGEPRGIGMIPHFTTPDMDEFAARLRKAGIPWLRGPVRESFGIEAFFLDPDGYQWAVVAPLEPK